MNQFIDEWRKKAKKKRKQWTPHQGGYSRRGKLFNSLHFSSPAARDEEMEWNWKGAALSATANQSHPAINNKRNLISFIFWFAWVDLLVSWKNIITVNKGLLFIKYVNAISITFRIIKRFNFIYRILVLLKYFIFLMERKQLTESLKWNEKMKLMRQRGAPVPFH